MYFVPFDSLVLCSKLAYFVPIIYYFINFFIVDFLSVYKAFRVIGKIILLLDCILFKFSLYNCSVFETANEPR